MGLKIRGLGIMVVGFRYGSWDQESWDCGCRV